MKQIFLIAILGVIVAVIGGLAYYYMAGEETTTTTTTMSPLTTTATSTSGQETTTTTQQSQQTTTTTAEAETIEAQSLTINKMLELYSHAIIEYEYYNATSDTTEKHWLGYTISQDTLYGETVNKLTLQYMSDTGENTTAIIWANQDYSSIIQVEVDDNIFPQPYAEQIGRQLFQTIDNMLIISSSVTLKFQVLEGQATLMSEGWSLTVFTPKTIEIGNHVYSGYYFKAVNINDQENDASSVEGELAELIKDYYSLVNLKINLKDNDYAVLSLVELEPVST